MSPATDFSSDTAILGEVFLTDDRSLARQHAEWLLTRDFTEKQKQRIVELGDKSEEEGLDSDEQDQLDRFLRIGMTLNLLRAKAELTLRQRGSDS